MQQRVLSDPQEIERFIQSLERQVEKLATMPARRVVDITQHDHARDVEIHRYNDEWTGG